MTTHSKLSPSARHRWAYCPGSVREEAKYPESPSSDAAKQGTHDHTLLETCIKQFHDASQYIGLKLADHEGEFLVDSDRAERVQFALNYIEERSKALDCDIVISEKRVDPSSLVKRNDMSGTVDIQLITPDVVELVDYKGGMNPTDALEQLEQYAVGVVAELQAQGKYAPLKIKMTVVQPKLRMRGMSGIVSTEITLGELMVIKDKMIAEAAATDDPNALLIAGDKQCKYCKHAGNCTALTQKALGSSGITFANLDVAKQSADKEPTSMTDQQLREIIEAAPLLRQMIEGAEAEALRRIEAGQQIEGIKAVRGRGSRGWAVSDENEMAEKLKKMGLPKDVIWQTKLISVAQAEKATWTKTKAGEEVKMQLSDRQLKTLKTEYTKTTEGKIMIAPLSDPRPAVTLSVAQMFTPVPTELPSFLL